MLSRRLVLGGALLLTAPGCGFRPIYASGTEGPAQAGLSAISVGLIPERTGQLLRQALQARLQRGPEQPKRYDLLVGVSVAQEGIFIQRDSTITRIRYIGQATWTLAARDATRATVTSGAARSVDGLNVFNQQYFATELEGEAVTKRITEALADQITLQLATYFDKHPT
ncbi:conserved protein of unknown function [Rhodovastum atsumiense]|nr:LPS assembly lipoprotein LptE [Rhodovastum atsumiense]CAH2600891.1 conserved protein of unknown function [Rhodovastum atsumiense]